MNFGGMPRGGGGRKVTRNAQICSRMRFRLWRDSPTRGCSVLVVPQWWEEKSNPSFFFPAFARASLYRRRVDISSFFSEMIIPLSFCVLLGVFEREIGFSKTRALRKRERERETNGWCGFRSPQRKRGKKREEDQHLILSPNEKKSAKEKKKKKRIETAKT